MWTHSPSVNHQAVCCIALEKNVTSIYHGRGIFTCMFLYITSEYKKNSEKYCHINNTDHYSVGIIKCPWWWLVAKILIRAYLMFSICRWIVTLSDGAAEERADSSQFGEVHTKGVQWCVCSPSRGYGIYLFPPGWKTWLSLFFFKKSIDKFKPLFHCPVP